jgi:opacity protein-like surface antigen
MRYGTIICAAGLAAALAGFAGAASAQDAEVTAEIVESVGVESAVSVAPPAPVAPWYQSFTQGGNRFDLSGFALDRGQSSVEIEGGSNWGLSLGFESAPNPGTRAENVDGLSAGAYFKVSPRVRVGGELGYRSQSPNPAGLRPNGEVGSSEVKVESAFRF